MTLKWTKQDKSVVIQRAEGQEAEDPTRTCLVKITREGSEAKWMLHNKQAQGEAGQKRIVQMESSD